MELVIDRGVKSYDVKDADGTLLGVIKINPADIGISGRFVSARKAIAELAEQAKTPFLFLKFERKSRYFFFILKSKSFQFFCKATAVMQHGLCENKEVFRSGAGNTQSKLRALQ